MVLERIETVNIAHFVQAEVRGEQAPCRFRNDRNEAFLAVSVAHNKGLLRLKPPVLGRGREGLEPAHSGHSPLNRSTGYLNELVSCPARS